jgi:hypothetical protein
LFIKPKVQGWQSIRQRDSFLFPTRPPQRRPAARTVRRTASLTGGVSVCHPIAGRQGGRLRGIVQEAHVIVLTLKELARWKMSKRQHRPGRKKRAAFRPSRWRCRAVGRMAPSRGESSTVCWKRSRRGGCASPQSAARVRAASTRRVRVRTGARRRRSSAP